MYPPACADTAPRMSVRRNVVAAVLATNPPRGASSCYARPTDVSTLGLYSGLLDDSIELCHIRFLIGTPCNSSCLITSLHNRRLQQDTGCRSIATVPADLAHIKLDMASTGRRDMEKPGSCRVQVRGLRAIFTGHDGRQRSWPVCHYAQLG